MKQYFITEVSYTAIQDDGSSKPQKELFLVDALTFTEAESKTVAHAASFVNGEFQVTKEKIAKFSEIIKSEDPDAEIFYKVKVQFIFYDEKSGKEKKTSSMTLVQAKDPSGAAANLRNAYKTSISDYEIVDIVSTKISEVI